MPLAGLRALVRDLLHRPGPRRARRGLNIALAPRQYLVRRRVAQAVLARTSAPVHLDPRTGFARFGAGELPGLEAALDLAQAELARARPQLEALRARRSGRAKLVTELGSDALLERVPAFLELALSDALLLPVVEYLGEVPWLARISLPLTQHLPGLDGPAYFQRFHVDNEDLRQVKVYLQAQDVGAQHGPLCFLPADTSERVLRALAREGRPVRVASVFSDKEVFRHCERSELVTLSGARGSGAFVDLSRCLHYGSRVAPGQERLLIGLVYLRRHALHENPSSQFAARRGLDPLRTLALDPPRRYPPGTFCPDQLAQLEAERRSRG